MTRFALLTGLILAALTATAAEVPTITCPAEPPLVRRLELHERWRLDADDPDVPLLSHFGQGQILIDGDRVYLLDLQLCHVLVYSLDGEHLDTIMHEGEGPGEMRNPSALLRCADGRLAVQHGYPTKLEFVDTDGTPRGSWRLQSNAWVRPMQDTPLGWYGVYTESRETDDPTTYDVVFHAALHDAEGARIADFHSYTKRRHHGSSGKVVEADEHEPWYSAVAVGDSQVVIAAARDSYRLEWWNLEGGLTRVVTRAFQAHRRTQAELDDLKYRSYSIFGDDLQFTNRELCSDDAMIRGLEPLPDGRLRVRTSLFAKDLPTGMVCRYELHAPDGELLERVEIFDPSGSFDWDYDGIALLDDGRAMVLRNQQSAERAAIDGRLHPKVREKLPPIPDDRDDVMFTPIMCDLVPVR